MINLNANSANPLAINLETMTATVKIGNTVREFEIVKHSQFSSVDFRYRVQVGVKTGTCSTIEPLALSIVDNSGLILIPLTNIRRNQPKERVTGFWDEISFEDKRNSTYYRDV